MQLNRKQVQTNRVKSVNGQHVKLQSYGSTNRTNSSRGGPLTWVLSLISISQAKETKLKEEKQIQETEQHHDTCTRSTNTADIASRNMHKHALFNTNAFTEQPIQRRSLW
eukprot:801780_1